ncbi:MAG: tail fiber domain-containing protein [Ferruginibacter sp.]
MKTKQHLTPILIFACVILSLSKGNAQGVGINSTGAAPNPSALLHVDLGASLTKGFLVTGSANTGSVPNLGAGSRLMFYPGKAAFRSGIVNGTQWDDSNVGYYSIAMGYSTTASGSSSFAMGYGTTASGNSSNAMGLNSIASGDHSTAMGLNTIASGSNSNAMGFNTNASGYNSTSMGFTTNAIGDYSTAMGYNTTASGNLSTAIGTLVNTNNQIGAFIIGDSDPSGQGTIFSGFPNEFVARFWNGYYFLTSGNTTRFGVSIGNYGNSWVSICDKNRKENFEQLDGEDVLQKISNINFSSWNYKQQDPKIYRHYGIMAQDFYKAFGHDKYGSIGNDTTVNPIDMIGIDMTAIQALEKRTSDLKKENEILKAELNKLSETVKLLMANRAGK